MNELLELLSNGYIVQLEASPYEYNVTVKDKYGYYARKNISIPEAKEANFNVILYAVKECVGYLTNRRTKKRTDNNALVDYRTYEENENKTIKKENEQ